MVLSDFHVQLGYCLFLQCRRASGILLSPTVCATQGLARGVSQRNVSLVPGPRNPPGRERVKAWRRGGCGKPSNYQHNTVHQGCSSSRCSSGTAPQAWGMCALTITHTPDYLFVMIIVWNRIDQNMFLGNESLIEAQRACISVSEVACWEGACYTLIIKMYINHSRKKNDLALYSIYKKMTNGCHLNRWSKSMQP